MSRKRVVYFHDNDVGAYTYGLGHPMKPHRIRVTHELVTAYNMLDKMQVLRPKRASPETITSFHTDEYVHFLSKIAPEMIDDQSHSGLRAIFLGETQDNPAFEGVFEFCSISAGGSIDAADRIATGSADIAINWAGGLHHAKKREASGFCYINDIVLGILELLRTFPRVLYIDIDCHHGDGVEEAFYTTDRVMTCSFHKFGEYFPGTGTQDDRGRGQGKGYALNVPLKDGITDESFRSIFEPVITKILEVFRPSAVVLQCGADSLAGDKLGCFNITMHGHAHCVQFLRKHNVPLILLGGGGYTVKNVARTWAYETACALGIENDIDDNLPWNEYFEWFGPRYRLEVLGNNMVDVNLKDGSLDKIRNIALEHLNELPHAPSVALQDVPREKLSRHLGLPRYEEEERDELDEKLAQHARFVYKLQESETTDDSDDPDAYRWDSEDSSSSRHLGSRSRSRRRPKAGRKRMSIMTNQYEPPDPCFEHGAPTKPSSKRRFFQTVARWDDVHERVLIGTGDTLGIMPKAMSLAELMESGGMRSHIEEEEIMEEDTEDFASAVES